MKILFIGTVEFSSSSLAHLIKLKANIVGVCTVSLNKYNSDYVDLGKICCEYKIPIHYSDSINSLETLQWIRSRSPDVIFCFGISQILKLSLLSVARMGVIGFHPTLLPLNRGRHPIIWSLALGLNETGSTFYFMDEGVDSGDILSQQSISIGEADNASSLYKKITDCALAQITDFLPALELGQYVRVPQEVGTGNTWRKRCEEDGRIDWRMSADAIYNLVRALSKPYPGAYFLHNGLKVRVWQSLISEFHMKNIEPGKIISIDESMITVKAGQGAITLTEVDIVLPLKSGDYL